MPEKLSVGNDEGLKVRGAGELNTSEAQGLRAEGLRGTGGLRTGGRV